MLEEMVVFVRAVVMIIQPLPVRDVPLITIATSITITITTLLLIMVTIWVGVLPPFPTQGSARGPTHSFHHSGNVCDNMLSINIYKYKYK